MKKLFTSKYTYAIWVAMLFIIEIPPYGVKMMFKNEMGQVFQHRFSYFSFIPLKYSNFGHLLTGLVTAVLLIISIIYMFKDTEKMLKLIHNTSFIASITSVISFSFGIKTISIINMIITLSLIIISRLSDTNEFKIELKKREKRKKGKKKKKKKNTHSSDCMKN